MFQGGGGVGRLIFYFERVQRIVVVLGVRTNQRRDGRSPGGAHFLPAIEIAYRVLQDALKQRRQFRARTPRIFLGQFHHGILDDIQSDVLVPYAKKRLLVCPTFHLGEEVRQFLVCSQFGRLLSLLCSRNVGQVRWLPFLLVGPVIASRPFLRILANHSHRASERGEYVGKCGYHAVYKPHLLDRQRGKR